MSIFRDECNYGQRLQEYALCTFIKKYFNCDCKLIDTRNYLPKKTCKDRTKLELFYKFESDYIDTEKLNFNNEADFYVIGSDQVFNWQDISTDIERKYFTCEWIKEKSKIFTYAASFDLNRCGYLKYFNFFKELNCIKNISLREKSNIDFLTKYCPDSNITYNIDPVFLLDKREWLKISKKPEFIKDNELFDFVYTTYSNDFRITNKKTYYCSCINHEDSNSSHIGPSEFIWLINNCDTFYTCSYHGFCLGKILDKNVINILYLSDNDVRYKNTMDLLNNSCVYYEFYRSMIYFERMIYGSK